MRTQTKPQNTKQKTKHKQEHRRHEKYIASLHIIPLHILVAPLCASVAEIGVRNGPKKQKREDRNQATKHKTKDRNRQEPRRHEKYLASLYIMPFLHILVALLCASVAEIGVRKGLKNQ